MPKDAVLKKYGLWVIVVVAAVAVAGVIRSVHSSRRAARSEIVRSYTYRCGACNAVFEMDDATLKQHERAGQVKTPPTGFKQYPCPECGEIAAYYYEGPAR